MEVTFAVLLWGLRLLFLLLLYFFLFVAFRALQRELALEERHASGQRGLAYLVVQRTPHGGPRLGERHALRAVNGIGRDAGNDVVLNDEAASARHATVEFADGAWWISDAGSTNGTFVNGAPIRTRTRLDFGDEVGVGRVALRLEQA